MKYFTVTEKPVTATRMIYKELSIHSIYCRKMKQEDEETSNPFDCESGTEEAEKEDLFFREDPSADKEDPLGPLLILKLVAFSLTSNWLLKLVPISSLTAIMRA